MAKRRTPAHLPTYTHPRSSFAGIRERLALASLAMQTTTWMAADKGWLGGKYMHSIRLLGKTEGWEARLTWADNCKHVDLEQCSVRPAIAHSIEAARATWFDNKHPSKELLAIVANVAARKQAA